MKIFLTGGTGLIGTELVRELHQQGYIIHLLVRRLNSRQLESPPGVKLFEGDINDADAVTRAMNGCTHVFHLAALARMTGSPASFEQINVEGTRCVLEIAMKQNVKRVVFTSTAGTLANSADKVPVTEDSPRSARFHTEYDRTKRMAEQVCAEYRSKGLDIVTVYPTRVYGPGILHQSNAVTLILKNYAAGYWRFIPGSGHTIGNYVFLGDLVKGMIAAMFDGKPGEDYILGGHNASFRSLFDAMAKASRRKRTLITVPYSILWVLVQLTGILSKFSSGLPPLSSAWLRRYFSHSCLSSEKAMQELDYKITPLQEGLEKTLVWLRSCQNNTQQSYALITGASSGIGRAYTYECVRRAWQLVLVDLPDTGLKSIAADLQARYGCKVHCIELDLREKNAPQTILHFIESNALSVRLLINNVGSGHTGNFAAMHQHTIERILDLNISATTLLTRTFISHLKQNAPAWILNMGSFGGYTPLPGKAVYAASKAYVLFLSRALRDETHAYKIQVSCVLPAGVPTNEDVRKRIEKTGKIGRMMTISAEQVAKEGLDGLFKKQSTIIPGYRLKGLYYSLSLVPQGILNGALRREFRRSADDLP